MLDRYDVLANLRVNWLEEYSLINAYLTIYFNAVHALII